MNKRDENQERKVSREEMEKTRRVEEKKTREQGKSNTEEEIFWLQRIRIYCKKLQSERAEGGCNTTIFKQI